MTDTNQLPPHTITIQDHPEPHIMQWSDLELAAVKRYAEQYALQAIALRSERVPMTDEEATAMIRETVRGNAIRREGSTSLQIVRATEAYYGITAPARRRCHEHRRN